jgi:O-antigen ligase
MSTAGRGMTMAEATSRGGAAAAAPAIDRLGALLLAAALFLNEAVFRIIDVEQFRFDWQIAMRLSVCLACGLYGLLHWPQVRSEIGRFPGAWVTLLAAWALVTVPAAINVPYAAASWAALVCMILFAPAVLRQLGGRRVLLTVLVTLTLFVACCWVVYFAVPQFGRTGFTMPDLEVVYRFGGLASANATGRVCALWIALLLVAGMQRCVRWRVLLPLLGVGLVTLVLTNTRTAMIAGGAAVALLVLRRVPRGGMKTLGLAAIGGVALAGLALSLGLVQFDPDSLLASFSRAGNAEEAYTLTGRTPLWEYTAEQIAESPLVGCGYACTRFVLIHGEHTAVPHAHNQVLNVALSCGLVGGLLMVMMFLAQLRHLLFRGELLPDAVTVFVLIGGIADCMAFTPIPDACTLIWLLAVFWRQTGSTLDTAEATLTEAVR